MPLLLGLWFMLLGSAPAWAENGPVPWQIGLQRAASPVMERLTSFHDLLLWICVLISVFVLALLIYVSVTFRADKHPTPSKRTHHTMIEVAWTAIPVLILVVIAIPSFKLLYFEDVVEEPQMTIKAIGHQWYWSYEYPDNGNFTFDANMIADEDLQPGQKRLLETDNRLVLPAGVTIRLQTTATDVLHSWAMPPFAVKMDAIPGRLNETWFKIEEPGTYYGQCSELCGDLHGFMPITIDALPPAEFEAWTKKAQAEFARVDGAPGVDLANR